MRLEQKIYSFEEENTVIGIGDASPFYIRKNRHTICRKRY